eukprot:jgi/Botrbrau1/1056/Bobra.0076s0022.1
MSRFKTDHIALPETVAAAHLAAAPPITQGAPPAVQSSGTTGPVAARAPAGDSSAMADALLKTLAFGPEETGAPAGDQLALPLPPGLEDAPLPYAEKPLDLFKAIFEASDSSDDEDEEEGEGKAQEEAGPSASQGLAAGALPAGVEGPQGPHVPKSGNPGFVGGASCFDSKT